MSQHWAHQLGRPYCNITVSRSGELGAGWHETGLTEPPQRHEELAGQRHNHDPADASLDPDYAKLRMGGPSSGLCAVRLVGHESRGELEVSECACSKGLQEGEEAVGSLETGVPGCEVIDALHGGLFHREAGFYMEVGSGRVFVAKPEGDDGNVYTRLEQVHRRGMPSATGRRDINTIRAWMGHVSLGTTSIHAEIDLEMKARAVPLCDAVEAKPGRPWKESKGLLSFLKSL